MNDRTTASLDFLSSALSLRAQRQRLIAGNIANADTPGYAARELDFADALSKASKPPAAGLDATHGGHLRLSASGGADATIGYEVSTQPSLDNNTVDLDRERAKFADNAVRYESTLRFINSHVRTMLSAIQGQ